MEGKNLLCFGSRAKYDFMVDIAKEDQSCFCMKDTTPTHAINVVDWDPPAHKAYIKQVNLSIQVFT